MKNKLSIGQMAKITGISIRSLRYYDELGILKPAYVDEQTGYRYYKLEQLSELYVIMVCIDTGIPLKEIEGMPIANDTSALKTFLQKGRELAKAKIASYDTIVKRLDSILCRIDSDTTFAREQGEYSQYFERKEVVARACDYILISSDEVGYKG